MSKNIQNPQIEAHRDITKNPFVRYQMSTIQSQLESAIELIRTPGTEVQLIADKALEMTLLNDALEVFATGESAGLEVTGATTGITVIEQLTGKTWKELNAPTPGDRVAGTISGFFNKAMNGISKGASALAEKTKR